MNLTTVPPAAPIHFSDGPNTSAPTSCRKVPPSPSNRTKLVDMTIVELTAHPLALHGTRILRKPVFPEIAAFIALLIAVVSSVVPSHLAPKSVIEMSVFVQSCGLVVLPVPLHFAVYAAICAKFALVIPLDSAPSDVMSLFAPAMAALLKQLRIAL
ncbi:MAG: hypothetical protein KGL35_24885 [Bradyrhizobium sp.]|nr:hypothetical protein [Bradyrhizobium sp.]